jgi:hypothetical protein
LEEKDATDAIVQSVVVDDVDEGLQSLQPYAEVLEGYAVQVDEQCLYAFVLEQREEEDDPYDPEYHD